MEIKFENVSYCVDNKKIINNLDLIMIDKKINAIVGPTGAGKSTIALLMNGLLKPSEGKIYYDDIIVTSDKKSKPINKKEFNVGLVLQFPEEQFFCDSVYKEISFGLKFNKIAKNEINNRVADAMKLLNLSDSIMNKDPFSLSSGEKRRVAIASMLVLEPKVLILDEPTVGLDSYNRVNLIKIIKNISNKKKITIIIISHDTDFINSLADYVTIINQGQRVVYGSRYDILSNEKIARSNSIKVPSILSFENYVLKKKNIKLGYRNDINDLIKDILRNV